MAQAIGGQFVPGCCRAEGSASDCLVSHVPEKPPQASIGSPCL